MLRIMMQGLDMLFNLATGLFLLRLLLNEISPSPFNPVIRLLHALTEPVLAPIRKILPLSLRDKLYLDISPIIAVVLILGLKFLTKKIVFILFLQPKG